MYWFIVFFCRNTEQDLFNILGSLYMSVILTGVNSCTSVIPYIITERTVLCREKFAGMYSTVAYSLAQVWYISYIIHILSLSTTSHISILESNFCLCLLSSGPHWDSICDHDSIDVHNHHISNNWLLLVTLQIHMVLLHHFLRNSQLCLPWNASCFIDSKFSNSFHILILSLPNSQSLLWLPYTWPCKYEYKHIYIYIYKYI